MPEPDLFQIFVGPLNRLGISLDQLDIAAFSLARFCGGRSRRNGARPSQTTRSPSAVRLADPLSDGASRYADDFVSHSVFATRQRGHVGRYGGSS